MMRKFLVLLLFVSFLFVPLFCETVKKSQSEVTFKKFGSFKSVQTEKITKDKKLILSDSSFKGKGALGKIAGKTILKSGESAQIFDLSAMTICEINHKKKEYSFKAIEKLGGSESSGDNQPARSETEESESHRRILSSEFKVEETGENKSINLFPSEKYIISWITEWEDTETGQTGKDSLLTDVWTTPLTDALSEASQQETAFSQAYMKALGFNMDELRQSILGTNWISLLTRMGGEGGMQENGSVDISGELSKIKGYPVIIDGKFFSEKEGGEEEKEEAGGGVKKMFGKLAKKALQKKDKNSGEPVLSYRTELIEFAPVQVDESEFEPPAAYKEKGK